VKAGRGGLWFWALLLGRSLFAQDAGMPSGTDPAALLNKPEVISASVSAEKTEDGQVWIGLFADVQVCSELDLERMKRTATDYENYPRFFKRNKSVTVSRGTDAVYQRLTLAAGFLRFYFESQCTVQVKELINTEKEFLLEFSHVSDDGSIRNIQGYWYFQTLPGNDAGNDTGKKLSYMRYWTSSQMLRKVPLQRFIMSMFIEREFRRLAVEFLKAASGDPGP